MNEPSESEREGRQMAFARAYAIAQQLPKIELHLHLDGSLPAEFIHRRAIARGIECPAASNLRGFLHDWKQGVFKDNPVNKIEAGKNWGVFDFCNQVLQTEQELEEAARLVMLERAEANVVHCEIRFCPELHTLEGLSHDRVVAAVCRGVESARLDCPTDLTGGVIVCALRSLPESHSLEMAHLAHRFLWRGVVGFDVAGDEGSFPLELHKEALEWAVSHQVPVTVHAGEWMQGTLPNVQLALNLGVQRIGHGMVMAQCMETLTKAADSGVTVECCLTSNVKPWMPGDPVNAASASLESARALFCWVCGRSRQYPHRPLVAEASEVLAGAPDTYGQHPITQMRRAGVRCALSSDNLMLSGTADRKAESTGELAHLVCSVGFSWEQAREVLLAGANAAFVIEDKRETFMEGYRQRLEESWARSKPPQ